MVMELGNWRWYKDDAVDPVDPLAPENVAPTLTRDQMQRIDVLRLRVQIRETGGASDSGTIDVEYSTNGSDWVQVGAITNRSLFFFGNGQATHGDTIDSQKLTGTDESGLYHENDTLSETVGANNTLEIDLALECNYAVPNLTYQFRLTENGTPLPVDGFTQITLKTSTNQIREHSIDKSGADSAGNPHEGAKHTSFNRVYFDGTRYWFFVVHKDDPTNVAYYYWDGPGHQWSPRFTIAMQGHTIDELGMQTAFKVIGGVPVVFIATINSTTGENTIFFRRGEISGKTITWDAASSISVADMAGLVVSVDYDDGDFIWIGGISATGIWARRSTNADVGSSWTEAWETEITQAESVTTTNDDPVRIIGLASDRAMHCWMDSGRDDWLFVLATSGGGFETSAQINSSAVVNDDNAGFSRSNGFIYFVATDTTSSSGGNWHFRVFDEVAETWADGTSPSQADEAGSGDGIGVCYDPAANLLYVLSTGTQTGGDQRSIEYRVYNGPGASGTWNLDGLRELTPASVNRGNGDSVLCANLVHEKLLLCLLQFCDDGQLNGQNMYEFHTLNLGDPPLEMFALGSAGDAVVFPPRVVGY